MHRLLRPLFFALALLLPPETGHAAVEERTAMVAKALDGDTLALTDGRRVRLDAINALEIPRKPEEAGKCLPSTRRADGPEVVFGCDLTLAQAALALARDLTEGKAVRLVMNPARREDRYGRLLAQVIARGADGREVDVGAALVRAGLAHLYPLSGQEIGVAALLPLEHEARAAGRGIWRLPELQVTEAARAGTQYGHYALISGTVAKVTRLKNRMVLNFGADYRTDFSVIIDKRDWRRFRSLDLQGLAGRRVLVRGFLHEDYGPAMRIGNPWQMELLP